MDTLRNRTTRSLSTDERDKITSIAKKAERRSRDHLQYNSAIIGPKAMPQVTALGQALTSDDLKERAPSLLPDTQKGTETYNQGLSERRGRGSSS